MSKLETNTIDTVSGTSTLQVGSTNTSTITLGVSGDTINVPSGVTINNNGTQTGFGGTNTPNFYVNRSGTQTISADTWTKVQLNNEVYDSSSAFDSSTNYRFTVPSGQGGKYSFQGSVYCYSGDNNLQRVHIRLYKNGSAIVIFSENDWTNQAYRNAQMYSSSAVLSLSAGDYIELWVALYSGGGTPTIDGSTGTRLSGYKIIE